MIAFRWPHGFVWGMPSRDYMTITAEIGAVDKHIQRYALVIQVRERNGACSELHRATRYADTSVSSRASAEQVGYLRALAAQRRYR